MDATDTVADLREEMGRFIAARHWERFHTPKNLAMGIAIEAAEIMEHFQWLTPEESVALMRDPQQCAQVADELADVMMYCLSLANHAGIDVSDAIRAKLARNETRFPPAEPPEATPA